MTDYTRVFDTEQQQEEIDLINMKLDYLLKTVLSLLPSEQLIDMLETITGHDLSGMTFPEAQAVVRNAR